MLRIGLFSEDRALQPLLSSALGKEYQVVLALDEAAVDRLVETSSIDILLLDLDQSHKSATHKIERCTQMLAASNPPLMVIMAEDSLRSTAADLVRAGAFGYLRRPPSIRDLKSMLARAQETNSLKRELRSVHQRPEVSGCCDRLIGSS